MILKSAVAVIFLYILTGCSSPYYKTRTVASKGKYLKSMEKARDDKRYFILFSGINIYSVTSVDVDKDKQQFTVQLDKVDSLRLPYLQNPQIKRYKSNQSPAGPELRVYMRDSTSYTLDEPHTLLVDKVAKVEAVE